MAGMTMDDVRNLQGSTVHAQDGSKIGSVEEIFYDADTNEPEWIGIGTGFFSSKRVLVPLVGASASSGGVTVPYSKDMVKDSPDVSGDEISEDLERQLYSYYGVSYSDARSDTTMADGGAGVAAPAADLDTTVHTTPGKGIDSQTGLPNEEFHQVTRSEEELAVGKRRVETGRLRVRKWVETEPVQAEVTLERETAHIVREPINQPVSGAQIGEDTIDVTLEGEEAVVGKQVVAKERIGVDVDRTATTEVVTDEVRKERVEVEEDTTGTTGLGGTTGTTGLDR
jgi:uncharacterized protein (TIGR02271 family)